MFGGMPSSSSRPASAPIAVIVPIVSKKSASISVKTKQGRDDDADVLERAEQVELAEQCRSRACRRSCRASAGTFRPQPVGLNSRRRPSGRRRRSPRRRSRATVVTTIEIRIAPLTLRTHSAITSSRPKHEDQDRPALAAGRRCRAATGTVVSAASGMRRTKPASTKPIRAMNRPMPTEIAILSWAGTAWKTASRKPVSTSTRMIRPSMHDQAHRVGPGHLAGDREGDERVEPEPGGQGQREVGDDAHQDRHHAGDQRRAGRDRRQVRRVAAAEELAVGVRREAEDERVEHDDVGHREEGDDPAADLAADGRAALGDLEEAVECRAPRRPVVCGAHARHHGRHRATGDRRRVADASPWTSVAAWSSATTSR